MGISYLVPWLEDNLNNSTFAGLFWLDKHKKIFRISWKHNRRPEWTSDDAEPFRAWALYRQRQGNPSLWKANLRMALHKSRQIHEVTERHDLKSQHDPYKVYQIFDKKKKSLRKKDFKSDRSSRVQCDDSSLCQNLSNICNQNNINVNLPTVIFDDGANNFMDNVPTVPRSNHLSEKKVSISEKDNQTMLDTDVQGMDHSHATNSQEKQLDCVLNFLFTPSVCNLTNGLHLNQGFHVPQSFITDQATSEKNGTSCQRTGIGMNLRMNENTKHLAFQQVSSDRTMNKSDEASRQMPETLLLNNGILNGDDFIHSSSLTNGFVLSDTCTVSNSATVAETSPIFQIKVYLLENCVVDDIIDERGVRLFCGDLSDHHETCRYIGDDKIFGPMTFKQISIPCVDNNGKSLPLTENEKKPIEEVLTNMNRGLILKVANKSILARRHCRARVSLKNQEGQTHRLNRKNEKSECIFDFSLFDRHLNAYLNGNGPIPSTTIILSFGQDYKADRIGKIRSRVYAEVTHLGAKEILRTSINERCNSSEELFSSVNMDDVLANAFDHRVKL